MPGLSMSCKATPFLAQRIAALIRERGQIKTSISEVVRDSAFSVIAMAKMLVPVSTGALRRSIMTTFYDSGLSALIGSWLPYAARQEFDTTLDHTPRKARVRVNNTKMGKPGSVIKGTKQSNPEAQWGFLRKALQAERMNFRANLQSIADRVGDAWEGL